MQECRKTFWACNIPTSFPGSLFSASLSRWNRDPGCGWSRDLLSIQNRRVGGYSSTFDRDDDKILHTSTRFIYHPDCGWSRDQPQPGSLFQRLREVETLGTRLVILVLISFQIYRVALATQLFKKQFLDLTEVISLVLYVVLPR